MIYLLVLAALHSKASVAGPPPTMTTSTQVAISDAGLNEVDVICNNY